MRRRGFIQRERGYIRWWEKTQERNGKMLLPWKHGWNIEIGLLGARGRMETQQKTDAEWIKRGTNRWSWPQTESSKNQTEGRQLWLHNQHITASARLTSSEGLEPEMGWGGGGRGGGGFSREEQKRKKWIILSKLSSVYSYGAIKTMWQRDDVSFWLSSLFSSLQGETICLPASVSSISKQQELRSGPVPEDTSVSPGELSGDDLHSAALKEKGRNRRHKGELYQNVSIFLNTEGWNDICQDEFQNKPNSIKVEMFWNVSVIFIYIYKPIFYSQ